jgi:SAM-dependent methyltransferase
LLLADVDDLICPSCAGHLSVSETHRTEAGSFLIEGSLACAACSRHYPVHRGIPRFLDGIAGYNPSWNYKWTAIDRGRGLNHLVLDKSNPAYALHDIYDRNSHGGRAFTGMRGGRVIDIGCGVGQYVLKSLLEHSPQKIVAFDLTEGVDTLRRIVVERHPELLERILFVQGSVFSMPFRPSSFDYVYSLGVLHHTGNTTAAIRAAAQLVREGGHLNIWVYAAAVYPIDTREPGRERLSGWVPLLRIAHARLQARAWYAFFSHLTPSQADRLLRLFSSDAWYKLSHLPVVNVIPRLIMAPPPHPDRDYRHINLFDGYVNAWAENWSATELFPVLRDSAIVLKGISEWPLGVWGVKDSYFYTDDAPAGRADAAGGLRP